MSGRGNPRGGQRGGRGRGDSGPRGRGDSGSRGRGDSPSRGRGSGDSGFQPRGRGGGPGGFGGGRGRGGPPQIFSAGVPPRPDARLASSEEAVKKNLKAAPYNPRNPLRPGYGTLGTEVILRANFFPITLPKGPIYEYTVEMEPKPLNKMKARLFQLLEKDPGFAPHVGYIAHDRGARLVAAKQLPQPLSVQVQFIEEGFTAPHPDAKTYTITIKANGELETSELQK
jgi:eukaryotic translation initiation factor 2C